MASINLDLVEELVRDAGKPIRMLRSRCVRARHVLFGEWVIYVGRRGSRWTGEVYQGDALVVDTDLTTPDEVRSLCLAWKHGPDHPRWSTTPDGPCPTHPSRRKSS